jgi:phosphoglucomutase
VGDVVVDKDGISAAVAMAELANSLTAEGQTLTSHLAALRVKYGLYMSYNTYLFVPAPAVTEQIFARLRGNGSPASYWASTAGCKVTHITDVTCGYDSWAEGGVSDLPRTPEAQMIMFEFENKVCITLRASGTEPKLKVYSEVVSEAGSEGGEGSVQEALQRFVEACIEEMLQPEANALVRA